MNDIENARGAATKLKTRHLVLVMALDEARNLHQAARNTHMSQPAASKVLKDMETLLARMG